MTSEVFVPVGYNLTDGRVIVFGELRRMDFMFMGPCIAILCQ